jgi:hypothetical protein
MRLFPNLWRLVGALVVVPGIAAGSMAARAADGPTPATVAEAAKVLDLSTLPLLKEDKEPWNRHVASLSYEVVGKVKTAFEFHQKQLLDRKWTQAPQSTVNDQEAWATFTRDGYSVSLTIFPPDEKGLVHVSIHNHGNVDLGKLPTPAGVKPFYSFPTSTAYITEAPVEATVAACQKLLVEQGWQPYGTAGIQHFFKQNAVRLSATIQSAPAEGGKTVITYSSSLMSADLPPPPDATSVQYAESVTHIELETPVKQADVFDFYRTTLAKAGWKPTTTNPIKDGFREELNFGNAQKDLLTLTLSTYEGKTRGVLEHRSAAQVAEMLRRADAQAAKARQDAKAAEKPAPKLAMALPIDAKDAKVSKSNIEFKLGGGRAKAVVAGWRDQFVKDGWTVEAATLDDLAGMAALKKGGQNLTLVYTDTGFLPAEVTVQAIGVELERAGEKK